MAIRKVISCILFPVSWVDNLGDGNLSWKKQKLKMCSCFVLTIKMFQDSCLVSKVTTYIILFNWDRICDLCVEVSLFYYEILQFLGFFFFSVNTCNWFYLKKCLWSGILKARKHILMDNVFCNQNCWGINSSCESHTNIHNLADLFKGCNGQLSVVYNLYKTSIFWKKYCWNLL